MRRILPIAAGVVVAWAGLASSAPAASWPAFLNGPQHSSWSKASAITVADAPTVAPIWHWTPPAVSGMPVPKLDASPVVIGNRVFIGSNTGVFYALREATGKIAWQQQLDVEPAYTCGARGIAATAAVANDPTTGVRTVYASGARELYALNAATGAVTWHTMIGPPSAPSTNDYYNWSSPTVVGGHIYVGLASMCDVPLIRGGIVELDQHTGNVLNTWYSVPDGSLGGSVWSTVAASPDGADLWASTGNACDPLIDTCPAGNQVGDSYEIVHLSGSLTKLEAWQVPGIAGNGRDWDFGSSPTLFGHQHALLVPPYVGACNKNGHYYALTDNPLGVAPLWDDPVGTNSSVTSGSCLASAIWDAANRRLFVPSNRTTIAGTSYPGALRQVDPATGAYIWELGLPCTEMGTPSGDAGGVIAVVTRGVCTTPAVDAAYLVDAGTGQIAVTLDVGGAKAFAQPVFADTRLFVATESGGLYAFAPT